MPVRGCVVGAPAHRHEDLGASHLGVTPAEHGSHASYGQRSLSLFGAWANNCVSTTLWTLHSTTFGEIALVVPQPRWHTLDPALGTSVVADPRWLCCVARTAVP